MSTDAIEKAVYCHSIKVPAEAIDENGHLNNVTYVQWMQDIAIAHANSTHCTAETAKANATWIARSHTVEYLRPAFEGEHLKIFTWIATLRRVRSQRRYKFFRPGDQTLVATGETEWVFVDRETGKPRIIPSAVASAFELAADIPTSSLVSLKDSGE